MSNEFVATAQTGIWTSAAELQSLPTSGPAWDALRSGADQLFAPDNLPRLDNSTNVYTLAAAIVYARTGDVRYRDKVIEVCEHLSGLGKPEGKTLMWARRAGAYALAADLVGYRTPTFEAWIKNMAETYIAEDERTVRAMFEERPNNWGAHAFGSLCAIYTYLGEVQALTVVRDLWIQGVTGPNPGFKYREDLSWHLNEENPLWINPKGAVKDGINIDGTIPDDFRRGGPLQEPPLYTNYAWGGLQGLVMAARILERQGLSIWHVADSAIYRVAYALQERFVPQYGDIWEAHGDDEWMLPFLDGAYGSNWSGNQDQLWNHGKSTGWGYVTLADAGLDEFVLTVTSQGAGEVKTTPMKGSYPKGEVVTLTAVPDSAWQFIDWNGNFRGSSNPLTIVVNANKAAIARFEPLPLFRFTTQVIGNGTIERDPDQDTYLLGTRVKLIARPDSAWKLTSWSTDSTEYDDKITIKVIADTVVTAVFENRICFDLKVDIQGKGTVETTPAGVAFEPESIVAIRAVPDIGWRFSHWSGEIAGFDNPIEILMTEPKRVTAVFVETDMFGLKTNAVGSGRLLLYPPGGSYASGTVVQVAAQPEAGWAFVGWSGDLRGARNPDTIAMYAQHQINAVFAEQHSGGGQLEIFPTDDAFVRGGVHHQKNFGDAAILKVREGFREDNDLLTYIRFDLSTVPRALQQASLELYCKSFLTDTGIARVYPATSSAWNEFELAWENAPPSGRSGAARLDLSAPERYFSFDVTAAIKTALAQEQAVTFIIATEIEKGFDICSSETSTPPRLLIAADSLGSGGHVPPQLLSLHQNYPNPFNPTTHIRYELRHDGHVSIKVLELNGQVAATLIEENQSAGTHTLQWEARDNRGRRLPSGVYLLTVQSGGKRETAKMILLR